MYKEPRVHRIVHTVCSVSIGWFGVKRRVEYGWNTYISGAHNGEICGETLSK